MKTIQALIFSTIMLLASLAPADVESSHSRLQALARKASVDSVAAAREGSASKLPPGLRRLSASEDREETPIWSPDGSAVLYVGTGNGPSRILKMSPGQAVPDTIVQHRYFPAADPALTPDGTFLAYQTQRPDTKRNLWVRRLADGIEGKLTEDLYDRESQPAWSRAGRTIYFVKMSPNSDSQRAMSCLVNGDGLRVVGREQGSYFNPCVSPDGSLVAWIHRLDRDSRIVLMNPEVEALSRGFETPGYSIASMDWMPDGVRLLVSYMDNSAPDKGFDLGLLDTGSGRMEPLLDLGPYDSNPRVSPDGTTVAFSSNPDGVQKIYLYTLPAESGMEE